MWTGPEKLRYVLFILLVYLQFYFILMILEELSRLDLEFKMSRGVVFNQNGSCDCLPSCTTITYNTEIIRLVRIWKITLRLMNSTLHN
jgi:hypothetical protein